MKRENETLLDLVERLKNHFEEQVSVVPKVKSGMSGMKRSSEIMLAKAGV